MSRLQTRPAEHPAGLRHRRESAGCPGAAERRHGPEPEIDFAHAARPDTFDHQSTTSRDDAEVPHSLRIRAGRGADRGGMVGWALLRFIGIISIVVIRWPSPCCCPRCCPGGGLVLKLNVPRSFATFLVLICGSPRWRDT